MRTPRVTVRKLRPEQVQELIASYEAGATMKELAVRFKIHRTTASEHLRRAGAHGRYDY